MEDIERYIEMLYEDTERLSAIASLKDLSFSYSNLQEFLRNEILMGALARLFREESKKNFELATNTATIFRNASKFSQFNTVLSHYKIGGLTMQLVDYELKRGEMWREQADNSATNENTKRKLEFAMRKQNQLITVCMETLRNLANDTEIEYKMVKRGILAMLAKCLDRSAATQLIAISCNFLWKLSAVADNHAIMGSLGIVTKCMEIVGRGGASNAAPTVELAETIFALLFNLSFDRALCRQMLDSGFINALAARLSDHSISLDLLYQISVLEDARAIIAFTDIISRLKLMLFDCEDTSRLQLVKALLVNAASERRNAQLISATTGAGLDKIVRHALDNNDLMCLKIVSNIVVHDRNIQLMLTKWMPRLLENVIGRLRTISPSEDADAFLIGYECLRIISHISEADWPTLDDQFRVIDFIRDRVGASSTDSAADQRIPPADDDVLLEIIILVGTVCHSLEMARRILPMCDRFLAILDSKANDTEFVIQVLYVFTCMIVHEEISADLCADDSQIVERFIRFLYADELRTRQFCEGTLKTILSVNPNWSNRLSEEKFRRHNSCWLEMVETASDALMAGNGNGDDVGDQFNRLILDADDILENSYLSPR